MNDKIHDILYDEKYNRNQILNFEKLSFSNIIYQLFKIKYIDLN